MLKNKGFQLLSGLLLEAWIHIWVPDCFWCCVRCLQWFRSWKREWTVPWIVCSTTGYLEQVALHGVKIPPAKATVKLTQTTFYSTLPQGSSSSKESRLKEITIALLRCPDTYRPLWSLLGFRWCSKVLGALFLISEVIHLMFVVGFLWNLGSSCLCTMIWNT